MTHGLNGYMTHRCRCGICRDAIATYARAYRARWSGGPPPWAEHGVRTTYTTYGCRCDECRETAMAYQRGYRAKVRAER